MTWGMTLALPVLAAGVTRRGPCKDGPGRINVPVAFDGMVMMPGDLVIGGEDGRNPRRRQRPWLGGGVLAPTRLRHPGLMPRDFPLEDDA